MLDSLAVLHIHPSLVPTSIFSLPTTVRDPAARGARLPAQAAVSFASLSRHLPQDGPLPPHPEIR